MAGQRKTRTKRRLRRRRRETRKAADELAVGELCNLLPPSPPPPHSPHYPASLRLPSLPLSLPPPPLAAGAHGTDVYAEGTAPFPPPRQRALLLLPPRAAAAAPLPLLLGLSQRK